MRERDKVSDTPFGDVDDLMNREEQIRGVARRRTTVGTLLATGWRVRILSLYFRNAKPPKE